MHHRAAGARVRAAVGDMDHDTSNGSDGGSSDASLYGSDGSDGEVGAAPAAPRKAVTGQPLLGQSAMKQSVRGRCCGFGSARAWCELLAVVVVALLVHYARQPSPRAGAADDRGHGSTAPAREARATAEPDAAARSRGVSASRRYDPTTAYKKDAAGNWVVVAIKDRGGGGGGEGLDARGVHGGGIGGGSGGNVPAGGRDGGGASASGRTIARGGGNVATPPTPPVPPVPPAQPPSPSRRLLPGDIRPMPVYDAWENTSLPLAKGLTAPTHKGQAMQAVATGEVTWEREWPNPLSRDYQFLVLPGACAR